MALTYRSSAEFGQALRMRIRALPPQTPILVVEGKSDIQMLQRYVHGAVRMVPAQNKDIILGCLELLSSDEREACTFVIDCDGEVKSEWRRADYVVISQFRDLDVDTALLGGGLYRTVLDYIGTMHGSPAAARDAAEEIILLAQETTANFGVVLDAARSVPDLNVKVRESDTGRRRPVRLADIPDSTDWVMHRSAPTLDEVLMQLGVLLGWSDVDSGRVRAIIHKGGMKECRQHKMEGCRICILRRFCAGHFLHAFLAEIIEIIVNTQVRDVDIARAIRVGATLSTSEWHVLRRLSDRGRRIGIEYVDHAHPN